MQLSCSGVLFFVGFFLCVCMCGLDQFQTGIATEFDSKQIYD